MYIFNIIYFSSVFELFRKIKNMSSIKFQEQIYYKNLYILENSYFSSAQKSIYIPTQKNYIKKKIHKIVKPIHSLLSSKSKMILFVQ